jgi:hypothetical protein
MAIRDMESLLGIVKEAHERKLLAEKAKCLPLLHPDHHRLEMRLGGLLRPHLSTKGSDQLEILYWSALRFIAPVRLIRFGNIREISLALTSSGGLVAFYDEVVGVRRLSQHISLLYHGEEVDELIDLANKKIKESIKCGFNPPFGHQTNITIEKMKEGLADLENKWVSSRAEPFPGRSFMA